MDNQEEILDALNGIFNYYYNRLLLILFTIVVYSKINVFILDFEKKPNQEIPPVLEQFLLRIAKTGETL